LTTVDKNTVYAVLYVRNRKQNAAIAPAEPRGTSGEMYGFTQTEIFTKI